MTKYRWLPLLLALQLADCLLAPIIGASQEVNRLMAELWTSRGFAMVVGVKMSFVLLCVFICWGLHHPRNTQPWIRKVFRLEMEIITGAYLGLFAWNLIQLP